MSFVQNITTRAIATSSAAKLTTNICNASRTHSNVSTSEQHDDPLISFTVPATMFAAGVIGNLLAILVLVRAPKEHKRTVFYRLVGALACTDLLGTCATSPVTLAVYANNFKWIGGRPLCNYISFMLIFASCSTILIICTMALDRFISICHPFFYDKHVTIGKTKYVIMALWAFAFVMGFLPIIGCGENIIQYPGTWCFFTFTSKKTVNKMFTYFYAMLGLSGILVTALSNLVVTMVLMKMRRLAKQSMASCKACSNRHSRETQMMVLMIGIVVIFSTCWCPFLVRIMINQSYHKQINVKVDLMTLRLASLNQILDPWVYILFRKEMITYAIKFIRSVIAKLGKENSGNTRTEIKSTTRYKSGTEGNEFIVNSMENNFDENDSFLSEISTATTKIENKKKSKSEQDQRLSLQKLMDQHNPQCFGVKHPACLFCFSNLPKAFALSLGTAQAVTMEFVVEEADKLETVVSEVDTFENEDL